MRHEAWRRLTGPPRIDFSVLPGETGGLIFEVWDSDETGTRCKPVGSEAAVLIDGTEHRAEVTDHGDRVTAVATIPSEAIGSGVSYVLLLKEGHTSTAFASGIVSRTMIPG
jgi:hypothetical protein